MTIRVKVSNRRASEVSSLLFSRIERFVNLPHNYDAFADFFRQNPEFLPVTFYVHAPAPEKVHDSVGWHQSLYELFRVFQNLLRDVWENGDNSKLGILLGIDEAAYEIMNRKKKPGVLDRVLSGPETAIENAMKLIPHNYYTAPCRVRPDWGTGTFRYEEDTDFRRAVYMLFRQSWRASKCPQCNKYFIADKPPQRYCSSKCYGDAKRTRDLEFWRSVGSDLRKKRKAKERKP